MKWLTLTALLLLVLAGCQEKKQAAVYAQSSPEPRGGLVVIHQSEPNAPGGNDTTIDTNAPREIGSRQMTLFDVTSQLPEGEGALRYVSAFAVPSERGAFLFLETEDSQLHRAWALVAQDPFPRLAELTAALGLAQNNGWYSETHGLPMNFGGQIRVDYAGGETIRISDNQSPVLDRQAGEQIAALFGELMAGEQVALPKPEDLTGIRFEEVREGGDFTRAELTLLPDGTAVNQKTSKYGDSVYESEKPVEAETVNALRENLNATGLLAWSGLPDNGFRLDGEKKLTFLFSDGSQVEVENDRLLPGQLSMGFFNVELEMSTKH